MKPFHTLAIPHRDILEGKLTMDIFAADLWDVNQGRGAEEYKDPETFFRKTYLTDGLNNLLTIVKKRLDGKGGDPIIQIQTPFGGGKTHALIAMYHNAKEWGAKRVIFVGTALSPSETLWGLMEKELTGRIENFSGNVAPGKEAIRTLISSHQPVLILMDELLEYAIKASGVKVGESTLASQSIAFMQEITEAVSTIENACIVVTLPSSLIEQYDQTAERFYMQLQKIAGRVEKIYTPVQENEISKIIKRRLFNNMDETGIKESVRIFIDYAEKEGMIPEGMHPSEYRDRFLDSYPFMPEVVDVLYHNWGSFPTFQRTRGVLRLLSLIVYSLKESDKGYISLADFDLSNQEIRQELLKHIGTEFNSVIAADITDKEAGCKKAERSLGNAYQGLNLSTRTAITIFMYSFSGGHEHGVSAGEIKRSATTIGNPGSVIAEAIEQLKGKLFYLQNIGVKYFFNNQPNLNRILLTNMENIKDERLDTLELTLLKENVKHERFKIFIWEDNPSNIPDTPDLKLLIMKKGDKDVINMILRTKGQTPRIYVNTLFFLYPLESERPSFIRTLKRKIAYENIEKDINLKLSDDQKKEIKKELKQLESDIKEFLRRSYRIIALPGKSGIKEIDLGIPTYGEEKRIDQEVYNRLHYDGELLEKVAPLFIRDKYLAENNHVSTEQLYQSSLKTPGETRFADRAILERGIAEGVQTGHFGMGDLESGKPICRYFKSIPSISFTISEIIIKESICKEQQEKERQREKGQGDYGLIQPTISTIHAPREDEDDNISPKAADIEQSPFTPKKTRNKIHLEFKIPKGKSADIMRIINLLQTKFDTLEINLYALDGSISDQDYDDKVREAFRQLGIEFEEDN